MACRTGCPTKDHVSYSECCRQSGIRIAYCNSTGGYDYTKQKSWDGELDRYRQLVKSGVQPEGTQHKDMDKAERLAEVGRHESTTVALES